MSYETLICLNKALRGAEHQGQNLVGAVAASFMEFEDTPEILALRERMEAINTSNLREIESTSEAIEALSEMIGADDTPDDDPVEPPEDEVPVCPSTGGAVCNCGKSPTAPPAGYDGPVPPETPEDRADWIAAAMAVSEMEHDAEHTAAIDLALRADATNVAVADGLWSDPATWSKGVPVDVDRVLIPGGLTVTMDSLDQAEAETIRVDGTLCLVRSFLRLEYLLNTGKVYGTPSMLHWVWPDKEVTDPFKIGLGIISMGEWDVQGEARSEAIDTGDQTAEDEVTFTGARDDWQVGDQVVVGSWAGYEIAYIAAISPGKIVFEDPLDVDHRPRTVNGRFYTSPVAVANMQRNVIFEGTGGTIDARPHTMFMNSPVMNYGAFLEFGRTDKSTRAGTAPTANPKGRYPLHSHKTGHASGGEFIGNVVDGSPGWGIGHHSGKMTVSHNIVLRCVGAGVVAEDGDESGLWEKNVYAGIRCGRTLYKAAAKNNGDPDVHDLGLNGEAEFFFSRNVASSGAIIIDCDYGQVWMTRGPKDTLPKARAADMRHPEVAYGAEVIERDHAPIHDVDNPLIMGCGHGIVVIKANPQQEHNDRSWFQGVEIYGSPRGFQGLTKRLPSETGIYIEYSARYTIHSAEVHGVEVAYGFGNNAFDLVWVSCVATDCDVGFDLSGSHLNHANSSRNEDYQIFVVDPLYSGVGTHIKGFNSGRHTIVDEVPAPVTVRITGGPDSIRRGSNLELDGYVVDALGPINRWNQKWGAPTVDEVAIFDAYPAVNGVITLPDYARCRVYRDRDVMHQRELST